MNFTVDCEFNGYQGELLSLALYNPKASLYVYIDYPVSDEPEITPWVAEHVMPHLVSGPSSEDIYRDRDNSNHAITMRVAALKELPATLEAFFLQSGIRGGHPTIYADWPDDVKYLSEALLTGPGTMINIPGIDFKVYRVDAYPTDVEGAIQHHAWWDAKALWRKLARLQVI